MVSPHQLYDILVRELLHFAQMVMGKLYRSHGPHVGW